MSLRTLPAALGYPNWKHVHALLPVAARLQPVWHRALLKLIQHTALLSMLGSLSRRCQLLHHGSMLQADVEHPVARPCHHGCDVLQHRARLLGLRSMQGHGTCVQLSLACDGVAASATCCSRLFGWPAWPMAALLIIAAGSQGFLRLLLLLGLAAQLLASPQLEHPVWGAVCTNSNILRPQPLLAPAQHACICQPQSMQQVHRHHHGPWPGLSCPPVAALWWWADAAQRLHA